MAGFWWENSDPRGAGVPRLGPAQKQRLPAQAAAALQEVNRELGEAVAASDTVELQDLGQTAKEASDAIHRMETAFTDAEIDELLGMRDEPPVNLHELQGLDRALQTISGKLTNNLAKLTELDEHIAMERRKLDEAEDEFSRRCIVERVRGLGDERASRLEAVSANNEALRSQINRMRETINCLLHEDTTLAERIRTLFREQGYHDSEHPHSNWNDNLYTGASPDWWWWRGADACPCTIRQRWTERVGQKPPTEHRACLGQTCWQSGSCASWDHRLCCFLAPESPRKNSRLPGWLEISGQWPWLLEVYFL